MPLESSREILRHEGAIGLSMKHIFTSESVTEGHPDKIADQVSDAVLDAVLTDDPAGRVACETLVTTGLCLVAGEITTRTYVDVPKLVRSVIRDIGFTNAAMGFDCDTCGVLNVIQAQSPDIAMGVDTGGAGDQGLMFGYACDETDELMPLPIMLAHQLVRRLSEVRRAGVLPYLRPDGKSQVSVEYVNGVPQRISAVVLSTQHDDDVSTEQLRVDVKKHVIDPIIPSRMTHSSTNYHINPTGRFVIGGPARRHRVDGPQDHCRYVWGHGASWRRRFFREGPDKGGSLGLLHGTLCCEEYRGCRIGDQG